MATELAGDDKPNESNGGHHEDKCGESAAQYGGFHIAEGEDKRRARQPGGDAGEGGGKAGGHLNGRVAAYPQTAEQQDGSRGGKTPNQDSEHFVAHGGEHGKTSSQTKWEANDEMAYGLAIGVLALDESVPEPHDLADNDERSGSESGVDDHQGRPGDKGRSESQRAMHHSASRGEANDNDDLDSGQRRLPASQTGIGQTFLGSGMPGRVPSLCSTNSMR